MSKRVPTQADVQAQGRCGNGFNYGGPGGMPRYCGKPSELGAPFGDCREHAGQFREMVRQIDQHERLNESARRLECGYRAVGDEHRENLPDGREEVVRRGREAQGRAGDRRVVEDNPSRGPFRRPAADPERTAGMVRAFFEGGAQKRPRGRTR